MTAPDHALVNRTTTRLEDRLAALGYKVGSEITYIAERDEIAATALGGSRIVDMLLGDPMPRIC